MCPKIALPELEDEFRIKQTAEPDITLYTQLLANVGNRCGPICGDEIATPPLT
jgi:hypothetical protein